MANLFSLIRLRKHSVDEKQRALAELYRQVEALEAKKTMLIERLRTERLALTQDAPLEMYAYFGRFSQNVQTLIEKINGDKSQLEHRINAAQEDVRAAFADMKRVEIIQKNRTRQEKKKQQDKESAEMDDIGIETFRRQEEPEDVE